MPFVLLAVLLYTLAKRNWAVTMRRGSAAAPKPPPPVALVWFWAFMRIFGPEPAAFCILFVRWLGYDFLNARHRPSCSIRPPFGCAAAVRMERPRLVALALTMAVANVIEAVGTRLALKHGAGFVRIVFIVVVSA